MCRRVKMGREITKLNFQLQPHPELDATSVLAALQLVRNVLLARASCPNCIRAQNKLSAPRILRMSKVAKYVQEKLEDAAGNPADGSGDVEIGAPRHCLAPT